MKLSRLMALVVIPEDVVSGCIKDYGLNSGRAYVKADEEIILVGNNITHKSLGQAALSERYKERLTAVDMPVD